MDPITTAIFAAISAGVATGATSAATQAVTDAYAALKRLLKQKNGANSEVVKAVHALEAKPDSVGRKESLKEEVIEAKVDKDTELLLAAVALLDKLNHKSDIEQITQNAIGKNNIQVAGDHATISVNAPRS